MERFEESHSDEASGAAALTLDALRRVALERSELLEVQRRELQQLAASVSRLVDFADPRNAGHSLRVADYAHAIGLELGLDPWVLEGLRLGGCLHDIGKLQIRPGILDKTGALTPEEFEEVRRHPNLGFEMLRSFGWAYPVDEVARFHHERWDGSGYPFGYAGDNIPLHARIVAVADVFDAMLSRRPHRSRQTLGHAMDELLSSAGILFDKDIVLALLSRLGRMGCDIHAPAPERGAGTFCGT